MTNEMSMAYDKYNERRRKAEKLHADLKGLYPDERCSNRRLFLKALRDGVISQEERDLLREFVE